MNNIWNSVVNWFKSKGGFTHVVAGVFASLVLAYNAVPAFRSWVLSINAMLPGWLESTVIAFLGIYAWYKDTSKK